MEQERIELVGTVDELIYSNEENGYTVLEVETTEGNRLLVDTFLQESKPEVTTFIL